jgi:hypothetical protein
LLEGVVRRFVIDTGSTISLIQPGISRAKVAKTDIAPIGITGKVLPLQGEQEIEFTIAGKAVRQRVGVCALPTEAEGLLGTDFMKANDARVDVANHRLELDVPSLSSPGAESKGAEAFIIFPARAEQAGRSGERQEVSLGTEGNEAHIDGPNPSQSEPWVIRSKETVRLTPRAKHMVLGQLDLTKLTDTPQLVCVEPVQ